MTVTVDGPGGRIHSSDPFATPEEERSPVRRLRGRLAAPVTLWTALETGNRAGGQAGRAAHQGLVTFAVLLVLQITWGAFVAGLKAGGIFNTFPLMGGSLFPPDFGNPLTDPATVQFVHRVLGTALFAFGLILWQRLRREGMPGIGAELGGAVTLQFVLGVLTILRWPSSPVFWGAVHQLGAVALLAVTVRSLYRSRLS